MKPQTQQEDEAIAKRVQDGDSEAFGVLVDRYEEKMLRYARRFLYNYEDIEDAVQEVFIKAYTNIQGFNTSMSFSPWIYRIAHNTFINVIKKQGREAVTFFDPDTLLQIPSFDRSHEEVLRDTEDIAVLETSLSLLDPKYREPLVLYYFEEKNYKEIADILRIPISTVGVRIKRGRERLEREYREHEPALKEEPAYE